MWDKAKHCEYSRARYAWLKEHKLCTACKAQDERTLAGRPFCERCMMRYRRQNRKGAHG